MNTVTTRKFNIIGAYCSSGLRSVGRYFGDDECYLFTLSPEFNTYLADSDEAGRNYVYYYAGKPTKDKKRGLGFGGSGYVLKFLTSAKIFQILA